MYLNSDEEHARHLRVVFQTLKEKKLYGKLSNYELYLHEVSFLGHMISSGGITIDLSKVDTLL